MTVREYALFSILPAIVLAVGFSFTIVENRGDNATPTPLVCPTVGPVPGSCDDIRLRCMTCSQYGNNPNGNCPICNRLNPGQTCGQPRPATN
jgi:hypothetical protein